jgi:hypothetical protein
MIFEQLPTREPLPFCPDPPVDRFRQWRREVHQAAARTRRSSNGRALIHSSFMIRGDSTLVGGHKLPFLFPLHSEINTSGEASKAAWAAAIASSSHRATSSTRRLAFARIIHTCLSALDDSIAAFTSGEDSTSSHYFLMFGVDSALSPQSSRVS